MTEIEELKRQWAYAGKPKQWQDGFDAMAKEYATLLNEHNMAMAYAGKIYLNYIDMESAGPSAEDVNKFGELYLYWGINRMQTITSEEFWGAVLPKSGEKQ